MIPVLLASSSDELRDRVHEATGGAVVPVDGPLPQDPTALLTQTHAEEFPEVVLLDAALVGVEPTLALAVRFERAHPSVSVVVVGDLVPEEAIAAMRAGVRDILHPDSSTDEIALTLTRASTLARERATALMAASGRGPEGQLAPRGRVVAVLSPKGGVGKTTVAINLAVGLARVAPRSTVLVDLDIQFGDVASGLNLEPENCLPEAVRGRATEDSMVLKTYLSEHASGLYVLCGPRLPTDADGITGEHVGRLLQLLASEFRYVVVDTAPGLSEHTLSVLDRSSDMVLVGTMDPLGVRSLRKELDTLEQLGAAAPRQLVLNFADRRSGMSVTEAEQVLGSRVDLVLPSHKDVLSSVNQGVPLLHGKARNPVVKSLNQLVGRYVPPKATSSTPDRLSGRHRGEKVSTR
ncbi:MAG: AAA family ATPase [Actinobacteria bacterium]|nr:AAA family ATPase [Actinomycetota bacterium]